MDAVAVLAPDADAVADAHAALSSLPGCSNVWSPQWVADGMESACVSLAGVAVELASSATVQRAFRTVGRPAEARLLAVGSCGSLDAASSLAVEALCGQGGALSGWLPSSILTALNHPRLVVRGAQDAPEPSAVQNSNEPSIPSPPTWSIKELVLGVDAESLAPSASTLRALPVFLDSPVPSVLRMARGPRVRLLPSVFSSIVVGVQDLQQAIADLGACQCGGHVVGFVGASGVRAGQPQLALPGLPALDFRLCDQVHIDTFFCESPAAAMQNVLPELHREGTEAMSCRGVNLLEMVASAKAFVQGKLTS